MLPYLEKGFSPLFFEQGVLHFRLQLGLANYTAGPVAHRGYSEAGSVSRQRENFRKSSRICFNLHFKVEVREEITCWEVIGKQEAAASHLCF